MLDNMFLFLRCKITFFKDKKQIFDVKNFKKIEKQTLK